MSKIGIIIEREYLRRVSKKSFILLTFFLPFLFVAMLFVPLWLSNLKGDDIKTVAVIDATGKYGSLFKDTDHFHFMATDHSLEAYRNQSHKEVFAILNITDDLLLHPKAATLYSEKQIPRELTRLIDQTISQALEKEKLDSFQIPDLKRIMEECQISFTVQTFKWSQDGTEQASSSTIAAIVGGLFTFIIYIFIMMYGAMVMQGVMEEKTNRIIELIISSVRPFELMMGKIIGIMLIGLTQMIIWGIMTGILLAAGQFIFLNGMDPAILEESTSQLQNPMSINASMDQGAEIFQLIQSINLGEILIFFIIYFIGGYLLYASLFSAMGAIAEHPEDTQQFMIPVTLIMLFSFYAGIYSMENPDGPLAFWCSMIPFTSPVVMMIRIPFDVPLWEKLVSVILLYGFAVGCVWFAAKIYRTGILMYGKKPGIREIIKWFRYK
ncbi:MAG: ABC transporter permease [Tannerellaceae bacterium]|nr:ABC transporter permease [Tannerellaceae bacterium]